MTALALAAALEEPDEELPVAPVDRLLVNVPVAAEALGISPWLLRRLLDDGDLPCVRIRTRRLIRWADLQTFVDQLNP
jgi:excisionase family DNA binding protein